MEILLIRILVFTSVGLFTYDFFKTKFEKSIHLPAEIQGQTRGAASSFNQMMSVPLQMVDRIIAKANIPLENLKRTLLIAGRPMNVSQFFALQLFLTAVLVFITVVIFKPEPLLLLVPLCIGYLLPNLWLRSRIKKRQTAILKNLPHIIDLLNICVGAGLDFMVAVNRVTQEFRPCLMVDELKMMLREIQMGNSRRDALKNLSARVGSLELTSFVRTLLQADRMGTPIAEALKVQAEELRIRRFQRGEEMGLKAPIKLLFPLLFFILPVVLIIVAGPILIQFTRGGFGTF